MEVILLERVEKLGVMGDTVRVKDGFARNFLLPRKKALRATQENKAVFEARRAEIEKENAATRKEAEKLAAKLEGVSVSIIRQASEDGRLYGSVNSRDIADQLTSHGIDRKHVQLPAIIKSIGSYTVKLALHPEVTVPVTVDVKRTEVTEEEAVA